MPLDFTAIDFETANSSAASACAVGLVRVRAGRIVAKTGWLIRPPAGHDEFNPFNSAIHGIRPEHVTSAAEWSTQLHALCAFAGADVLVAHNAGFDMNVLRRACAATGDTCPPYRYLCTVQLARKTYTLDSYRLPLAAAEAGFTGFAHHDATADAEACAHIVIDAARRHGVTDVSALADVAGIRVGRLEAAVPAAAQVEAADPPFVPMALESVA
ncbi:MAG TPA: DNA polymerase III subunit epsilon [Microbacterium sp.]|nr:DNA polymerase III subunit epsilon [Microbacterium sp.]